MNTFATIEEAKRYERVTYYTIRIDGEDDSEFEKWIDKHSDDSSIENEYQDILSLLERMGKGLTAKLRYFRNERNADALPPDWLKLTHEEKEAHIPYSKNLRLYCIRVTESIVILFNGAIKSNGIQTAEECPNVRKFFRQANIFAKAIDEAMDFDDIIVGDNNLLFDKDFELQITL